MRIHKGHIPHYYINTRRSDHKLHFVPFVTPGWSHNFNANNLNGQNIWAVPFLSGITGRVVCIGYQPTISSENGLMAIYKDNGRGYPGALMTAASNMRMLNPGVGHGPRLTPIMWDTYNNNVRQMNVAFFGNAKQIQRLSGVGNFIDDGFTVGSKIYTTSKNNPGPFTITSVSDVSITVSENVVTENTFCHIMGINAYFKRGRIYWIAAMWNNNSGTLHAVYTMMSMPSTDIMPGMCYRIAWNYNDGFPTTFPDNASPSFNGFCPIGYIAKDDRFDG